MRVLDELITAALQLADTEAVSHGARLWQSEGGRRTDRSFFPQAAWMAPCIEVPRIACPERIAP